ncbi:MAG: hypothetical protein U0Q12_26740 [Vicinamibacterales bacterium]
MATPLYCDLMFVTDVVPRRTKSVVSWTAAALLVTATLQSATPTTLALALVDVWTFVLLARSVEDRLDHGRFACFVAVAWLLAAVPWNLVDPLASLLARLADQPAVGTAPVVHLAPSVAATSVVAVLIGHLTLFPASRMLAWLPGLGQVPECPVPVVGASWLLLRVALSLGLGRAPAVAVAAHDPLAMLLASAAWGAIGVLALRHRERSSPQWWDAWEAAPPAGATAPSALGPNASRHA